MSGIARSLKLTHARRFTFSIHREFSSEGLSPGRRILYFLASRGWGLDKGFAVLCFAQYVVNCDVIFHLEMRLGNCCDSGS